MKGPWSFRAGQVLDAADFLAEQDATHGSDGMRIALEDAGIHCQDWVDLYDVPGYFFISPFFSKIVVSASLSDEDKQHLYAHFIAHTLLGHFKNTIGLHIEYLKGWEPVDGTWTPRHSEEEAAAERFVDSVKRGDSSALDVAHDLSHATAMSGPVSAFLGYILEQRLAGYYKAKAAVGYRVAAKLGQQDGYILARADHPRDLYILENGVLKRIADLRTLCGRGKNKWDVRLITQTDFDKLPQGKPVRFAQLMRLQGQNEIYLVMGGTKHHVVTLELFDELGFSHWDVREVDLEEWASYATGGPLDPSMSWSLRDKDVLYGLIEDETEAGSEVLHSESHEF